MCVALAGFPVALRAQAIVQDHPGQYNRADVENGSRLYAAQCAQCHGPTGETVPGVDLRRGQFRSAASDEDLARAITMGVPGTGMPPFALEPSELTGIIAFIRAGLDVAATAVRVGHAGRGRDLFDGKGGCAACHRVAGRGPRLAPDLSDIGAIRSPAALQRSVLDPNAAMLPINRPIRLVTRDGKVIEGRRLNEDTYTIQLMAAPPAGSGATGGERLVSIAKADLRDYEVATMSPMPAYRDRLDADEIADMVAYLVSLKGVQR
jgi:putative heme-binding domain-containing protein